MSLRINILCRNHNEDRVIPRMARYLADRLGWSLTAGPTGKADVLYLLAYFEAAKVGTWPTVPVAAYFTHREEEPKGNAKAKQFDMVARRVDLRVVMCALYGGMVEQYGATIQPPLPVERERFTPLKSPRGRGERKVIVGLSGYTYSNKRKGEDLVRGILASRVGQRVEWVASGRGWPLETRRYSWAEMPQFYQSLDVLVCPSRVEGGPLPVLEALACGVSVVVPSGVGIIDELPVVEGIHRYERGDLSSMTMALEQAVERRGEVDGQMLRAAVAGHSVEAFVEAHRVGFEMLLDGAVDAGIEDEVGKAEPTVEILRCAQNDTNDDGVNVPDEIVIGADEPPLNPPVDGGNTAHGRGIYCVAFGDPARGCGLRLMESAKRYMPDIPIALCAAKKIGPEDVLIVQPDSDVGGRRAKLKAYELAPAEWKAVLYLDADTEVVAPIYRFFEWIEDGWEFVICKDPHLMDTLHAFQRRNNRAEMDETERKLATKQTLQWNGGVWAFGRSKRTAAFFERWRAEWEVYAQRDQGALLRAMYAAPLRLLVLGNEWNTFPKYSKGVTTAGLMHYPGDARRWKGMIPGRIDSPEAWAMVKRGQR